MKLYTIIDGEVYEGATVTQFSLKNAGIVIPAIVIGEEGHGRALGVLPVKFIEGSTPEKEWSEKGETLLHSAIIGATRAGKPKLLQTIEGADEKCICVFRTSIGFRGGNFHSGDLIGEGIFAAFPGEIITRGIIAQGDAGRMGSGEQIVAVIPPKSVFRTAYTGRLYGKAPSHYYMWDGKILTGGVTWDERDAIKIF
jgi:hypothetical protein